MQAAQAKKEKEMQKKAVRKEKKKFRDTCKVSLSLQLTVRAGVHLVVSVPTP